VDVYFHRDERMVLPTLVLHIVKTSFLSGRDVARGMKEYFRVERLTRHISFVIGLV
jgi:hypothetical protein